MPNIHNWAASCQNQENGMTCAQRRLWSASSESSLAVRMKKAWVLHYPLSAQPRLIRQGGCACWAESSLGAQSFCWFCHEVAHLSSWHSQSVIYLLFIKKKKKTSLSWIFVFQFQHVMTQDQIGNLTHPNTCSTILRLTQGVNIILIQVLNVNSDLGFMTLQDYFTHFEVSRSLGAAKPGDPPD